MAASLQWVPGTDTAFHFTECRCFLRGLVVWLHARMVHVHEFCLGIPVLKYSLVRGAYSGPFHAATRRVRCLGQNLSGINWQPMQNELLQDARMS